MLGKNRKSRQLDLFEVPMEKFLDPDHDLVRAGQAISWQELEQEFSDLYSDRGRPSIPVRRIAGLYMLKTRYQVGEEKALQIWLENPYWQFFSGEVHFQREKPFSVGEFSRFKKRVGEAGMTKIELLAASHLGIAVDPTYHKYRARLNKRGLWSILGSLIRQKS